MDLRSLKTLLHVVQTGSLREAAAQVHLSPAAVHKQMKVLEGEVGAPLYTLQGKRLLLTEVAHVLIPYARTLVAQHEAAVAAIDEWRGLRRGLVRIGSGPTICTYLLPRMLKRFRTEYPHVDLQVQTGNSAGLLDGVEQGMVDVAFLVGHANLAGSRFRTHLSWGFDMVLVSRHRTAPRRMKLEELASSPMILFQKGSHVEAIIEAWFAANRITPRVAMRLDNSESIKSLVRAGLGLSFLPYWSVAREIREGQLSMLRLKADPPRGAVELVSHSELYSGVAVQSFIRTAAAVPKRELQLEPAR